MRFSTVTILAFIAYTSNQAIAAPIHTSHTPSQSLEETEPEQQSSHRHASHESHRRAKHARVPALDGQELAAEKLAEEQEELREEEIIASRHGQHLRHNSQEKHSVPAHGRGFPEGASLRKRHSQDVEAYEPHARRHSGARSHGSAKHVQTHTPAEEELAKEEEQEEEREELLEEEIIASHHGQGRHPHHNSQGKHSVPTYAHDFPEGGARLRKRHSQDTEAQGPHGHRHSGARSHGSAKHAPTPAEEELAKEEEEEEEEEEAREAATAHLHHGGGRLRHLQRRELAALFERDIQSIQARSPPGGGHNHGDGHNHDGGHPHNESPVFKRQLGALVRRRLEELD